MRWHTWLLAGLGRVRDQTRPALPHQSRPGLTPGAVRSTRRRTKTAAKSNLRPSRGPRNCYRDWGQNPHSSREMAQPCTRMRSRPRWVNVRASLSRQRLRWRERWPPWRNRNFGRGFDRCPMRFGRCTCAAQMPSWRERSPDPKPQLSRMPRYWIEPLADDSDLEGVLEVEAESFTNPWT